MRCPGVKERFSNTSIRQQLVENLDRRLRQRVRANMSTPVTDNEADLFHLMTSIRQHQANLTTEAEENAAERLLNARSTTSTVRGNSRAWAP